MISRRVPSRLSTVTPVVTRTVRPLRSRPSCIESRLAASRCSSLASTASSNCFEDLQAAVDQAGKAVLVHTVDHQAIGNRAALVRAVDDLARNGEQGCARYLRSMSRRP